MTDREKVIKGLEILKNGCEYIDCYDCCFYISTKPTRCGLREEQIQEDAIAILKEQQEQIDRLIEENASNAEMAEGLKELLKEQEAGHWILLENCSNSGVYCSECHTKVFDNYPFKKKFSYFCPHC